MSIIDEHRSQSVDSGVFSRYNVIKVLFTNVKTVRRDEMGILTIYLVIINVIAFLMYGMDKWKAKRNAWRISEKTLLLTAFAGGSAGALMGMFLFRHKTKHISFMILVPLFLVIHIVLIMWISIG